MGMRQSLSSPPHIRTDLRPTDRELRWFAHIDRHGPQSSEFLFEATRDTHRCKDTALRRMQALREAGYLRFPPQQRQIAKAEFNAYVYDLTQLGWAVLADHKVIEKHCRPTGHWWHGFWVSSVSSAIEISVLRAEQEYVPAARILALRGVDMGIPVAGSKLIPDQLFAIRSRDGYRAFALEVDRGTEPVSSVAARKSLEKSLDQYQKVLEHRLHQRHFGMKSNLMILWVFSSKHRRMQFEKMMKAYRTSFRTKNLEMRFPRFGVIAKSIFPAIGAS